MIPGPSHETKHCVQCNRPLSVNERVKIIKTSIEATQVRTRVDKSIEIGDTLCNNCRIQVTRTVERRCVCIHCDKILHDNERKKSLTEEDITKLAMKTNKVIQSGDIICNKCRILLSRISSSHKQSERRPAEADNTTTNEPTNETNPKKRQLRLCAPKLDIEIRKSSRPSACVTSATFNADMNMPSFSGSSSLLPTGSSSLLPTEVSSKDFVTAQNIPSDSNGSPSTSQGSSLGDPTFQSPHHQKRPDEDEQYVLMPFKRPATTHKYCCICGVKNELLVVIPFQARLRAFVDERIYIPTQNRCCRRHLLNNRLYEQDTKTMSIISHLSYIPVSELAKFLDILSVKVDETLLQKIGEFNMPAERIYALTGYTWENILEVRDLLLSMRNSCVRDITQALVVFLFKLRSGNSNSTIASILGIQREQAVSDFVNQVIRAYEVDILDKHFGVRAISREDLISQHTTDIVRGLLNVTNQLVIICDGTYLRHEKSGNNFYQRKSFSGQKKTSLCKPFTICASNGYIIDIAGPFYAVENDAVIMKKVLSDPTGLSSILRKNDIFVLDRGFRDILSFLSEKGFRMMMPALKGKNKQLTHEQSNHSRIVTKIRWPVESVHGVLGQKFHLLHHQFSNKLLPKAQSIIRIAGFMYNRFCKRLGSDGDMMEAVINRMKSRKALPNDLSVEMEEKRWARRKTLFEDLTADRILDFPELTIDQMKLLFTGSYQLKQALSYLGELMGESNDVAHIKVAQLKEVATPNTYTLKFIVQSRHINSRTYRCFIRYKSSWNDIDAITGYVCECANGNRTIGTCSHVAALIYFLAHGRYQSQTVKPNEVLSRLFHHESLEEETVIDEDSDED